MGKEYMKMDKWKWTGLVTSQKSKCVESLVRMFGRKPRCFRLAELLVIGFMLVAINSRAQLADLFDFNGTNGAEPLGTLAISGDVIYGTTFFGNTNLNGDPAYEFDGTGTIFRMNIDGTCFTNLYNFSEDHTGAMNSDGADPMAGLVLCSNVLFGTASMGGANGLGTVFKLNTDGTGFTNLHDFSTDTGSRVNPDLVLSSNTLYGTTRELPPDIGGTVFKINTDGTGFTILYTFTSIGETDVNSDGYAPWGRLLLVSNTLYGMTFQGGTSGGGNGGGGSGTIFKVNTDGTGFANIHNFSEADYPDLINTDGANPLGGLTLVGQTLFGMTFDGGSYGGGTIFKINTDGTGFTKIFDFNADGDGGSPTGDLTLFNNMLCGTAQTADPSTQFLFVINTNGADFEVPFSATSGLGLVANRADLTLSDNVFYGGSGPGVNSLGAIIALKLPITLNSNQTNYTFRSGWTYYIAAPVTLYGTTTIQAGAVIKYDGSTGITIDGTNLVCTTTPTNPAIFTVKDDDSVGAIIPGSTGIPSNYGGSLNLQGQGGTVFNLSNLSFFYQSYAIYFNGYDLPGDSLKLFNVQANNCWAFVWGAGVSIDFQNCLFANMDWAVLPCADTAATAENTTLDTCGFFSAPNDGGGSTLTVVNCLLANVPGVTGFEYPFSDISDYESDHTAALTSDSGVFQTATTGNFYLPTSSPYRDAGTTSIDAGLLSELEAMTTYAPADGNAADSDPPDLGYHYPRQ